MNLWNEFLSNQEGDVIHKWHHYFPIYERHFSPWRGRSLTFLEIGVQNGGSTQMWRRYFGPLATIIGIDIEPKCKRVERDGIHIRIGDQSDSTFLTKLIDEFGIPDVVLDDGSHNSTHVRKTFNFLYPRMGKNAVYLIEDMQAAYHPVWDGGIDNPNSFINHTKSLIDDLHAFHRKVSAPDYISKETFGIHFYDSVICFEKGNMSERSHSRIGKTKDELF